MRPQPRMQNKISIRVSHHGHTGTTRHSPRNGFTAYFALSPVTTLFDTVACASYRRLDANDWGVRTTRLRRTLQHHSSSALPASTASRPAFVTIAIRPSCRNETVRISELIWVGRKQKYFCKTGLTRLRKIRSDLPVGHSNLRRHPSAQPSPRKNGAREVNALGRSTLLRNAPVAFQRPAVHNNARVLEQHARGFLGGAGHRGVVAHQVLRDRAVDQQRELGCERICIGDVKLHQEIAEPEPAALLEGDCDLLDGAILRSQLGHRVDERTAAKTLAGETALQPVERSENLFGRRL